MEDNSSERVKKFIASNGLEAEIRVLEPESTRTSLLASQALGCSIAEIAKTIGFIKSEEERAQPILVILSGDKKVDLNKLARQLSTHSSNLRKMSASEVKDYTGYSIGGVPPFPHSNVISVFADESLFRFERIWAAAGSSNSVIMLKPSDLTQLGISKIDVAG